MGHKSFFSNTSFRVGFGVSQVEYTRQQVLSGYIFLDWFAIPQITARAEGVNEESTKSDAALAVQSIPFYVEMSNIFLALVPEVKHCTTGKYCNYSSWLCRGHQVDTEWRDACSRNFKLRLLCLMIVCRSKV